jgi:hypothetical protein
VVGDGQDEWCDTLVVRLKGIWWARGEKIMMRVNNTLGEKEKRQKEKRI